MLSLYIYTTYIGIYYRKFPLHWFFMLSLKCSPLLIVSPFIPSFNQVSPFPSHLNIPSLSYTHSYSNIKSILYPLSKGKHVLPRPFLYAWLLWVYQFQFAYHFMCRYTHTICMHMYTYIYIYVYIQCMNLGRKCDRTIGENLEENE